MTIRTILLGSSAFIPLALGSLHLLYTYCGSKLLPRDPAVIEAMRATTLVITRETTVWKAWIGFNATHSMALMLFGLLYGYLALALPKVLLESVFLKTLGGLTLVGFLILCKLNFFSVPLAGISVALALYVCGLVAR